jgi:hypothetical protein
MEDECLVSGALSGDISTFEKLTKMYYDSVRLLAFSILKEHLITVAHLLLPHIDVNVRNHVNFSKVVMVKNILPKIRLKVAA